jgi:hypothetical protein
MQKENRIAASTIGQIERGDIKQPPKKRLIEFARIFNVTLKFLMSLVVAVAIAWFSHGAASAVTCALACEEVESAEDLVICNIEPFSDPIVFDKKDNIRFEKECRQLYSKILKEEVEIHHFTSDEGYRNHFEVLEKCNFIQAPGAGNGAECSGVKMRAGKKVYEKFWKTNGKEYFGFDIKETDRAKRFNERNPGKTACCPLIDRGWDKNNCNWYLEQHGIKPPKVYSTFCNNNCVGCAKASNMRYWNVVKEKFPAIADRMAKLERRLNFSLCRIQKNGIRHRIYIDELQGHEGRKISLPKSVDPKKKAA